MKSVAFITVGCKLNQFESEQMREEVEECGCSTCDTLEEADILVINTCTVTSKSDYRSRQAVRRAARANPRAMLVVTGCYAQRNPEAIAAIEGVDVILGNTEKETIGDYIDLAKQQRPLVKITGTDGMTHLSSRRHLRSFGGYTRAFVKIQDGCDNRCTYCAVPLARGMSRSKQPDEVVREIEVLAAEGYREVVLTGVHLGSYGKDLTPRVSLADLVRRVAPIEGLVRTRLTSIEPTDLTAELAELVADPASRICPHFHVPLQSGDDRILRLMGRPYDAARYRDVITRIDAAVPDCGIGADVMVGFPGEDDPAFENTLGLVRQMPFTYLHVFAFSRRAGTPASGLPGQVAPEVKRERSRLLRQTAMDKSRAFRQSLIGKSVEILVLGAHRSTGTEGLSGNYVKARLDKDLTPNTVVSARVTGVEDGGIRAQAVPAGQL
jgi:threonylcarbamoyladenosine tRNA methylthiotransferase MtaB